MLDELCRYTGLGFGLCVCTCSKRFAKESEEVWTEKSQTRKGFSEGTATAQEMLGWKKASKETLNVEDFDFEDETPDEAEEDDPLGLALSNKKRKGQGQRGRKGRKGRKEGKVGHRKPGHPMQTSS